MSDMTINLTPAIYDYLKKVSLREPDVLASLRRETQKMTMGVMQISPEQGQFMRLLMELLGARKTLDIGTFTGYSALSVALGLPEDGKVIACDVDERWTTIARQYWDMAKMSHKIDLKLAPAVETLDALLEGGQAGTFDFAFIDADKQNYIVYYEKSLALLRPGGLIAVDNTLWSGKVADPGVKDKDTAVIRELNLKILTDDRVSISLLPVGDGLTLALKRV